MLVFLQIPRSTTKPYQAFRAALGAEAVGWVGHNIKVGDLGNQERLAGFKVVGGGFTLVQAAAISGASAYAAMVGNPVKRALAQWSGAVADVRHPFHATTHTFMLREVFEEDHPFAADMSNVATRFLMPTSDAPPSAGAVLEGLKQRRFIIGEGGHVTPFANLLARVLDVPPATLDENAFKPPHVPPARGELLRLLEAANEEDTALVQGLKSLRVGRRNVVRTGRGISSGEHPRAARPRRRRERER